VGERGESQLLPAAAAALSLVFAPRDVKFIYSVKIRTSFM